MKASVSKGAVLFAGVVAVCGIVGAVVRPTLGYFPITGSMLLNAWSMAFIPAPSIRTPLRDVYQHVREGAYRKSTTAKHVDLGAVLLFTAGLLQNIAT